jgi:hypothetical protein
MRRTLLKPMFNDIVDEVTANKLVLAKVKAQIQD